jgi:predicted DNA-binding protein (MmcQ/YjbR family)
MNKKHWNTVEIEGGIPAVELRRMIDHSYELVVKSLPKRLRLNQQRQRASRFCR